ncbi:hypothetical protein N1851_008372 [Merluccius polli]|uniref:BED-type domain-containing protein n=1 Tax=Merluccius polli TaxID=89951 RepID=A0AA47N2L1_MERPO|nr:hypothetical protein N1851_031647 [Merluccius polli]KAK0139526.1 hypothetical protein N1851_023606 [Merluccius polli]KAK0150534.1 hypothetical protein N1851_008372 [Merluccius polli]
MSAEDIAAGGGAESHLVPKHKSSSIIWRYFGFKQADVNQSEVLCRSCLTTIATKHGSTTNMFHHLKQHHRAARRVYGNERNTGNFSVIPKEAQTNSVTPYESTSTRHKDITDAITYHIAKDMVPVYTVSKEGFKKMVQMLDKR